MDDDPIRAVYDVSYARLVSQVVALCGNRNEAEDIVQEAFIAAMSHRATFLAVTNREAWLRTACLNLQRNRWRRARLVTRVMPGLRAAAQPNLGPAAPDDHVAMVTALRQLSPPIREAMVLHYIADLPVAEVARELEVPTGTVKARLSRGRVALAGFLRDDEPSEPTRTEADHV